MVYEESSSSENEIVSNAFLTSDFPWHSWLSCCRDSKILDRSAPGNIRIHFLQEGDTYQSICQSYQCKGVIVLTDKILPFNFWHHFNTDNFCKCAIFLVSLSQKDSFSSDKLMIKVSAPPNLQVPQIRIEKTTMGGVYIRKCMYSERERAYASSCTLYLSHTMSCTPLQYDSFYI